MSDVDVGCRISSLWWICASCFIGRGLAGRQCVCLVLTEAVRLVLLWPSDSLSSEPQAGEGMTPLISAFSRSCSPTPSQPQFGVGVAWGHCPMCELKQKWPGSLPLPSLHCHPFVLAHWASCNLGFAQGTSQAASCPAFPGNSHP